MSVGTPEGWDAESPRSAVDKTPPVYHPTIPLDPTDPPPPVTPANWYPDPSAPGLLRYWDGTRWTDHRQTVTPAATATVINNISVPRGGNGSDVALHLILTILTCGLWLPFWILIEIIKAISR